MFMGNPHANQNVTEEWVNDKHLVTKEWFTKPNGQKWCWVQNYKLQTTTIAGKEVEVLVLQETDGYNEIPGDMDLYKELESDGMIPGIFLNIYFDLQKDALRKWADKGCSHCRGAGWMYHSRPVVQRSGRDYSFIAGMEVWNTSLCGCAKGNILRFMDKPEL